MRRYSCLNGMVTMHGTPEECWRCAKYRQILQDILDVDIEPGNSYTVESMDYIRAIERMKHLATDGLEASDG